MSNERHSGVPFHNRHYVGTYWPFRYGSRNPGFKPAFKKNFKAWIPAFAGMTVLLFALGATFLHAEDDPRVRVMLEEGLRLYSEKQYVRALDLFKQVQRLDPSNNTAEDYAKNTEQRIVEWESQGSSPSASRKKESTWDTLLDEKKGGPGENAANARDIIAARRSLVERMRNRSTNTDNIGQIQVTKGGLEINLFHDQLFLPGLLTLRDEALPVLENVAQLSRQKGDRDVSISSLAHGESNDPFLLYPDYPAVSVDPLTPKGKDGKGTMSFLFQDIEATRAFILFTYLAQRSMGKPADALQ